MTHRHFNTVELTHCNLNVTKTPLLWVMMEKQCNAATQQKLVDYVRQGGKLILIGRMCIEDFNNHACTILKDAIGIRDIDGGQPWISNLIKIFDQEDNPVSFVEIYTGNFEEIWATNNVGNAIGLLQPLGLGKVMLLGATLTVENLDDLNIMDQIAQQMGCEPLFELSNWADVRISHGNRGSFVFINNYLDDPVESTIKYRGEMLFGGHPIILPARSGQILPLEWHLNDDVVIHYCTSEIQDVSYTGTHLIIKTAQDDFTGEMSLGGYSCSPSIIVHSGHGPKVTIHSRDGEIVLFRASG